MKKSITNYLNQLSSFGQSFFILVTATVFYVSFYIWKTPVFVLDSAYLQQPLYHGSEVTVQTAFAFAQTAGYFSAKFPAVCMMSSKLYFDHRLGCIIGAVTLSAVSTGVGFFMFDPEGPFPSLIGQVCMIGLSGVPAGVVFGMTVSYLEGRQQTELLLALLNFAVVIGGSMSRGYASQLIQLGAARKYVPLLAAATGLSVCLPALLLLSIAPKPSGSDVHQRCKRGAMTHSDRKKFMCRFSVGIVLMLIPYALIMTMRTFRDYYTDQIFQAAIGEQPTTAAYFLADLPGAVVSTAGLTFMVTVKNNRRAVKCMLLMMICGCVLLGVVNLLFAVSVISGYVWIVGVGAAIYIIYLPMGAAFFDRILAASNTEGTVIFIAYLLDGSGYVGVFVILTIKCLGVHLPAITVMKVSAYVLAVGLTSMLGGALCYFMVKLPKLPKLRVSPAFSDLPESLYEEIPGIFVEESPIN